MFFFPQGSRSGGICHFVKGSLSALCSQNTVSSMWQTQRKCILASIHLLSLFTGGLTALSGMFGLWGCLCGLLFWGWEVHFVFLPPSFTTGVVCKAFMVGMEVWAQITCGHWCGPETEHSDVCVYGFELFACLGRQ